MQHQDWTQVIFRKKKDTAEVRQAQKSTSQLGPQYKARLHENTEEFANKMFDKDYIHQVIQKRLEKKMTQKQLATALNIDVHIIQRFEQGKEVYDHILKSKLNRVLGITNCH